MVTFQQETWDAIADELQPIYEREHLPETAPFRGQLSTTLNREQYEVLARSGQLCVCTGRDHEGSLVAYYLGVLSNFPSTHTRTCFVMLYFVRPAWRKRGLGRALFQAAEGLLQQQGIDIISAVSKLRTDAGRRLFEDVGFAPEETVYLKWIGKE